MSRDRQFSLDDVRLVLDAATDPSFTASPHV